MTPKTIAAPLAVILLAGTTGCVNLKAVSDYSTSAVKSISQFEEINYSFGQYCMDRCAFEAVRDFEIKRKAQCNCDAYEAADKTTLLIYNAIKNYFSGLAKLSDNDLTTYSFSTLEKSLTEGTFGDITIEKKQADAYSAIAQILFRAATNARRQRRLKYFIGQANAPVLILLEKFRFILQENLEGELKFKRERLYDYYMEMKMNGTLSDYEKGEATKEYYHQLSDLDAQGARIDAFAKGLETIAKGHQQLYDKRDKMTAKEIKDMLTGYAGDIKDLMAEFNKLKNG